MLQKSAANTEYRRQEEDGELDPENLTGQSLLQVNASLHEEVLFIRNQLNFEEHPIRAAIETFKGFFCDVHMVLLCKESADGESDEPFTKVDAV